MVIIIAIVIVIIVVIIVVLCVIIVMCGTFAFVLIRIFLRMLLDNHFDVINIIGTIIANRFGAVWHRRILHSDHHVGRTNALSTVLIIIVIVVVVVVVVAIIVIILDLIIVIIIITIIIIVIVVIFVVPSFVGSFAGRGSSGGSTTLKIKLVENLFQILSISHQTQHGLVAFTGRVFKVLQQPEGRRDKALNIVSFFLSFFFSYITISSLADVAVPGGSATGTYSPAADSTTAPISSMSSLSASA
jgi:hypothetical protein